MITEDEMRALLRRRLAVRSGATIIHHDSGVSQTAICRAKYGYPIQEGLANHLGYRRVTMYESIE